MTEETARNLAINVLGRLKGVDKLMPSAKVDYVSIQISVNGSMRFFLDETMHNSDDKCIIFNRIGDTVDEGELKIYDRYGNEVA